MSDQQASLAFYLEGYPEQTLYLMPWTTQRLIELAEAQKSKPVTVLREILEEAINDRHVEPETSLEDDRNG
jgi:hypothetical protein